MNKISSNGETPLYTAAKNGHLSVISIEIYYIFYKNLY